MIISVYFARITFTSDVNAWDSHPSTMFVGQAVVAIVFWTGIIKMATASYQKWNRKRMKTKAATD